MDVRVVLSETEEENRRLRATLAVMRSEMEALQAAAGAAADSVLQRQQQPSGPQLHPQEGVAGTAAGAAGERHPDMAALLAELQESDRDLQLALEHAELLQQQLQAVRLGAPPPATTATAAPPPPLAAAAAGASLAGGQLAPQPHAATAAASATAAAAAAAEVAFLRQRLRELTAANRALRRAAMQAQAARSAGAAVAAAAAAAGLMPGAAAVAGAAEGVAAAAAGKEQGPAAAEAAPAAGAAEGAPGGSAAEQQQPLHNQEPQGGLSLQQAQQQIAQLKTELERARCQLATVRQENERLMDLSNEVRAQRDRYGMQLAALMAAAAATGAGAAMSPLNQDMRAPHFSSPPPLQPLSYTPLQPTYGTPPPPPQPAPVLGTAGAGSASPLGNVLLPVMAAAAAAAAASGGGGGLGGFGLGFGGGPGGGLPYGLLSPSGALGGLGGLPQMGLQWLPPPPTAVPPVPVHGGAELLGGPPGSRKTAPSSHEGAHGGADLASSRSPSPPSRRSTGSPTRIPAGTGAGAAAAVEGHASHRSRSPSPPRRVRRPGNNSSVSTRHSSQSLQHLSNHQQLTYRRTAASDSGCGASAANPQAAAPSLEPHDDPSFTTLPHPVPPARDPTAQAQLAASARHSPFSGSLTASARETQSQRASLRALHRRREQQQQQSAAAASAAAALRQRVRSYTVIRDEGEGPRVAAGGPDAAGVDA
ncbi:hypothetical protein Agub_g15860, partial [Astrephomene gubernaculifera]